MVKESRRLQIAGLVLGCVSFLHPLLMVGSAVLNLRELLSGRGGTNRWMNVAGASLTGLAVLTWTMVIIYFVIRA